MNIKKLLTLTYVFLTLLVSQLSAVDWTVMVYMCADNSLNDQSYIDLNEMTQASTSNQIKIIVQVDNIASSIEPDCRQYLIENGQKTLIANLGEVDMANPRTLIDFVRFSAGQFTADKYLLILWDHGNGWPIGQYGVCDEKGIIYDQSSNNWIGVAGGELKYAVTEIRKILRTKLSILGFDACLMGMAEVASEIANSVEIMFASEEVTPWNGLPYNDLLTALTTEPSISAKLFAQRMVDITINSYNNGSQGYEPTTFSAIDLSKFSLAQNDFSKTCSLLSRYINSMEMKQIRNSVQTFSIENNPPNASDDYIDLIDFLERSKNAIISQTIKEKIEVTINYLKNSVISQKSIGASLLNSKGIAVWFPDNYIAFKQQLLSYNTLDWQKKVQWLSFLNDYYGIDDVKPCPTNISNINIGGKNDFRLFWSKSLDLAPVRYDLIEATGFNLNFIDFCNNTGNWDSQGFTISSQYFHSSSNSFYSGNGDGLNNKITLSNPIIIPSGGILSFWSFYSTEERYLLTGSIKRDIFYVEISNDINNYSLLDSFYGKSNQWIEHRYTIPSSDSLWLRFRYVTDASISDLGVFIDDIKISAFASSRLIVSNLSDTNFYIFNIPQGTYYYFVNPKDFFGNIGFTSPAKEILLNKYCEPFSLPSPFSKNCKIYCDFPSQEKPDLYIYTLNGEFVKKIDHDMFTGDTVYWNGKNDYSKDVAAGIYLIMLKSNNFTRIGKLAKIK